MVIDLNRCTGCHACTVACKAENQLPDGITRSRVVEREVGIYPAVRRIFRKQACMHCQKAPCIEVCPTGASRHTGYGTVEIETKLCIGCGYCVQACPYGARVLNRQTGYPEKCTFCLHRIEEGLKPACETTCIGRAIVSGDLNDPHSEVSRRVAEAQSLHPEYGTKPSIYYIPLRR